VHNMHTGSASIQADGTCTQLGYRCQMCFQCVFMFALDFPDHCIDETALQMESSLLQMLFILILWLLMPPVYSGLHGTLIPHKGESLHVHSAPPALPTLHVKASMYP